MENIIIPSLCFIALCVVRAQMLQKIEDNERYPGVKLPPNKRGNLYTRILRVVIPRSIK
jgi:hypothetical protein